MQLTIVYAFIAMTAATVPILMLAFWRLYVITERYYNREEERARAEEERANGDSGTSESW